MGVELFRDGETDSAKAGYHVDFMLKGVHHGVELLDCRIVCDRDMMRCETDSSQSVSATFFKWGSEKAR